MSDFQRALEAAVRIGAESEDENHSFYAKGTGFVCRYRRRTWLVTAKHVLADKDLERLCVPWNLETHDVMRFIRMATTSSPDEDSAFTDIAVIEVTEPDPSTSYECIDISAVDVITSFVGMDSGAEIFTCGFPICLANFVDYEALNVSHQRAFLPGRYIAASSSRFLHRVQIEMGELSSLDGMSGSPIFLKPSSAESCSFAGVLVSANTEGLAHFIDASVILALLRDASA